MTTVYVTVSEEWYGGAGESRDDENYVKVFSIRSAAEAYANSVCGDLDIMIVERTLDE